MRTFDKIIQSQGYCCATEFFLTHQHKGTKEMAELLKLAPRTIRLHKQIVQNESECPGYSDCLRKLRRHREPNPDTASR